MIDNEKELLKNLAKVVELLIKQVVTNEHWNYKTFHYYLGLIKGGVNDLTRED